MTHSNSNRGRFVQAASAVAMFAAGVFGTAQAAVPGISAGSGTAASVTFNLAASPMVASMPDGANIYSWGYGCGVAPPAPAAGAAPVVDPSPPAVVPSALDPQRFSGQATCRLAQLPGPTLVVTEGQTVTVNLYNGLPAVAGNTSIVFSGFQAKTATGSGVPGLVTQEAAPGTTVSYTFVATRPGTYAYYSGTRPEVQIEMGLFGAVVVLPKNPVSGTACAAANPSMRETTKGALGGTDYRLSTSAYDNNMTCYDREFLFQYSEMDSDIHQAVSDCVNSGGACTQINVVTDPYHPDYFLVNGRSFPDNEDANFSPLYPNQPYNGNPQIHPGETLLIRLIGQGRWQHPIHTHAEHERILAHDGNMLISATDSSKLAGPLLYTMPSVSGQALDAIWQYTGKGLNWDIYGHNLGRAVPLPTGPTPAGNPYGDPTPCFPDANGFYTMGSTPPAPTTAPNYFEWCADHNKPIPVTPADPQILANGLYYGGTPYLGITSLPVGANTPQFLSSPLPPGTNIQNSSAGYAFMWHSHDERELTTNDVFPGGMLMMLIVQPPKQTIDETY